jgi:hypothetical protein
MLNRRTIVAALAAVLFCTTINNEALAAPFQLGDFITYSQDSWGDVPSPGNAAQLLADNFDSIYGGGVEVGLGGNAGFSMIFTSVAAILNYLPSNGGPGALNADFIDPSSTPSGLFGGYVLALQLDVDFSDAGVLTGSAGPFGDLILSNMVFFGGSLDMSALNGLSVRQFLGLVNTQLGAGGGPYSYDDMAAVTADLGLAFVNGQPTQFAQDHLLVAPAQVPEPATLGLLAVGLVTAIARRFKVAGRSPHAR